MLLIDCPYCGERPEIEFRCGGEAHVARALPQAPRDDAALGAFLYERSNTKGAHCERWYHLHGCKRWFNALRDTVSDRFIATYRAGEERPNVAMG